MIVIGNYYNRVAELIIEAGNFIKIIADCQKVR